MCIGILILVFSLLPGFQPLRDVHLETPMAVKRGGFMKITCSYFLDRNSLYTAKLYLEDTEFFRFVPRDRPPTMVFPLQDASVVLQMNSINKSVVAVGPMHRGLEGVYKCEVTEEPLFHTIIKSSFVTVTEDPEGPPSLTTKGCDREGAAVTARCVSRGGRPPVNFTWYLDNHRIEDFAESEVRSYLLPGDVDTSVSELRLTVPPTTGPAGRDLRLRCATSQFDVYYTITDHILKRNRTLGTFPTNQTVALIRIPTQYFSLVLLFFYCVISSKNISYWYFVW